jgi:hypothetical protein
MTPESRNNSLLGKGSVNTLPRTRTRATIEDRCFLCSAPRSLLRNRTPQTQIKRIQTSMPWVGFEPTIPALERGKTVQALDRAATVIGDYKTTTVQISLRLLVYCLVPTHVSAFRPSQYCICTPDFSAFFLYSGQYLYMGVFCVSYFHIFVECPCTRPSCNIEILKYLNTGQYRETGDKS